MGKTIEVSNKFGNGVKFTAFIIFLLVFYGRFLPAVKIFGESMLALAFMVLVIPAIIGFGASYLFIPNHNDGINDKINKIGLSALVVLLVIYYALRFAL